MKLRRVGEALRSVKLTLVVLLALTATASVGTLPRNEDQRSAASRRLSWEKAVGLRDTFRSPVFATLVVILTANILVCTIHRYGSSRRRLLLRRADAVMHLSLVMVMAGGAVKGFGGFVGTQNVPVGTETSSVFDWRARSDVPLGFGVRVERLVTEYYPVRARVGLTDPGTGRKIGMIEVREGREGAIGGIAVGLLEVDREEGRARFRVRGPVADGQAVLALSAGKDASAEAGGIRLTLIAYRDEVRMARALVNVLHSSALVTEAWLEPNGRLAIDGTNIFLTAWGRDEFGNPFAGIQVTRDPGAPLFWAGCLLLICALAVHVLANRLGIKGPPADLPPENSATRN